MLSVAMSPPIDAINGWMNSSPHRSNLLDPNSRETGLGYYQRSDGRGYVTQDFGVDGNYPPVVIENEAPSTSSPDVNLYIYNRPAASGMFSMEPAAEMQVSNDACFTGADWEPYSSEKAWKLADGGEGYRTVYVRTRDRFNRMQTVDDSIYYGASYAS